MRSLFLRACASLVLVVATGCLAHADGPTPPAAPATATPKAPGTSSAPTPSSDAAKAAKPDTTKPETAKPATAAKPETAATVVNLKTLEGVMGKAVRSRTGNEDMGHIVDVLVDSSGTTRAAVIDFGGFLGVGSRKVAVAWKTLDFSDSIQSGSIKVALTRDQVRQAPEYKPDEPIVIMEGTGAAPKAAVPAAPSPGHNQDAPAH